MARTTARIPTRTSRSFDLEHEHRVRERAYLLWESEGKPHGRDVEYWERARAMITTEEGPGNNSSPEIEAEAATSENPDKVTSQEGARTVLAPKRKTRAKPKKSG